MNLVRIAQLTQTWAYGLSRIEIGAIGICLLYLFAPQPVPILRDSSLGNLFIAMCVLATFVYMNPVVGLLAALVAYEMIRVNTSPIAKIPMMCYTPPQIVKDVVMQTLTPVLDDTLETSIIRDKGVMEPRPEVEFFDSTFQPVLAPDLFK